MLLCGLQVGAERCLHDPLLLRLPIGYVMEVERRMAYVEEAWVDVSDAALLE
jgi:hypothetical protein